jgi:hypothetical protein
MDDIAQQLAIRDGFRKKLALRQTPSERMAAMARLQESSHSARYNELEIGEIVRRSR